MKAKVTCPACGADDVDVRSYESLMALRSDLALFTLTCPHCAARDVYKRQELNCETDFVGMNEKFKAYAEKIAKAALAAKPADVDALKAAVIDGETVEEIVTDCIHVMGENTQLALSLIHI